MKNRLMLLVGCTMLAGCATMSPEECLQANWEEIGYNDAIEGHPCLLYTSPSPRDVEESRMPSSA